MRAAMAGGWAAGLVLGVAMAGAPAAASVAPVGGSGQEEQSGGLPAGSQMVRGTVTAVGGEGLTVMGEAGVIYRVTTTPNTRLMKGREPVKVTEIKAGDGLGAMGVLDPSTKTLHAMFVTVLDAEQVKKAQADLGKTYIAGEVTAMDEVKLTIKRPDGVVQTIEVDEGTSFRRGGRGMGDGGRATAGANGANGAEEQKGQRGQRNERSGGESITLADVKVGDGVIGRGGLKHGVFVPTELRVLDAVAARARRRSGGGEGANGGAVAPAAAPPGGSPR